MTAPCVNRNVQGETPQQRAEGQKLAREWFAAHPRDSPPSPLNRPPRSGRIASSHTSSSSSGRRHAHGVAVDLRRALPMYCIHCGERVVESAQFCAACGEKIQRPQDEKQRPERAVPVPPISENSETSGDLITDAVPEGE